MADGQDKSDDLIAELAKLMAGNAGSSEPEARPAPKLVSVPDDARPEGLAAAPAPVRIPGMDAPSSPAPAVSSAPTTPAANPTPASAPTPGVFRIPGMDQPISATPAPAVVLPETAAAPVPDPVVPRSASIDFGTMPAATTPKPEPMSNWQDREIPRPPVASRPVPVPVPVPVTAVPAAVATPTSSPTSATNIPPRPASPAPAPAVEPAQAASDPAPVADPMAELEAVLSPQPRSAAPVAPAKPAPTAPMVAAAQASPATDSFDFDFGFDTAPPEPISAGKPAAPAPRPEAPASGDPIADLIAAELDAPAEKPVAAAAPQPAPRPFPQPGLMPPPRPPANAAAGRGPVTLTQSSARPEDRFDVAPVFGPASKVQAPVPRPQPAVDPMDEIESLIGEAVRVELTNEKPAAVEPEIEPDVEHKEPAPAPAAPVVPPLTTGFAPRRASLRESEPQVPSAEAAILAAAAASGAEVGRMDEVRVEPSPYKRAKAKPERRLGGMRQYVGMAVAGTLLLAAGFGLYWVLGMSRGTDAEAPVLQADATPIKEAPPPTAPAPTNQGSVVFNELDGRSAPVEEQLVSRDDSEGTSVADVATPVGGTETAGGESELANRKVRTVTVRPDGTIVSGDDAVAGNEELPVDRPSVPDLPGAEVQPSELLAAAPSGTAATDPIAAAISADSADATQMAALPETPTASVDPNVVAPVPVARPVNRAALASRAVQPLAAAEPVASAPPAAASVGGSGPYVQLSSQPTEADAQNSLRAMQNRLSGLVAGTSLGIRSVDLGAKGTWYRVVLPVNSFQEATQTCASLKANGVDCLPIGG